jgi:hypothetical protein
MTNPVVTALTLQKANELRQRNDAVARDLQIRIGVAPAPGELPSAFVAWCKLKGVIPLPAKAESVALFLLQSRDLGVDALTEIARGIARAHSRFADPCSSWAVRAAFEEIGGHYQVPRSWPKAEWPVWEDLPWPVKRYLDMRERQRDVAINKAQQEAGDLRHKLREMEKRNVHQKQTAA